MELTYENIEKLAKQEEATKIAKTLKAKLDKLNFENNGITIEAEGD